MPVGVPEVAIGYNKLSPSFLLLALGRNMLFRGTFLLIQIVDSGCRMLKIIDYRSVCDKHSQFFITQQSHTFSRCDHLAKCLSVTLGDKLCQLFRFNRLVFRYLRLKNSFFICSLTIICSLIWSFLSFCIK